MQAQQICLLASYAAKGGQGMVQLAGLHLNLVLEDLKLVYNLKMNRVVQTITAQVGSFGPFALEADYLRTYDLFYPIPASGGGTSSGIPQMLTPITMEEWDAEFKDPSVANYPWEYATDLSTQAQVWSGGSPGSGTMTSAGSLFIYPQTSGTIQLTHRYMKNQPDMVTPETSIKTPWFPNTGYLIEETAARMMGITGDDRKEQFHQRAKEMLRPYLIMEGDEQQSVHRIKLDAKHFRSAAGGTKPTKANPYPG